VLAVCTGLAFGTAPALAIARFQPQRVLRDDSRGASESLHSRRLRGALVAGQIALCISLLAGAGLLTRSLWTMMTAPLGIDAEGVLTASVQLPLRDYPTPETRVRFVDEVVDRLRTLPGVTAAASATAVPTAVRSRNGFTIERAPWPDNREPFVLSVIASDDYFRTLRIPVREGRTFDARDRIDGPPKVVISETMARRYWPNGGAIGSRIRMGANPNSPFIEVVGIVGDVRNDPARVDAEPTAYRSSRQVAPPFQSFLLRVQGDPLGLTKLVEREIAAVNAGLAVQRVMPLSVVVGDGLTARRLPVVLMTAFSALALLLASVGVYAMFASAAAAREREFGVRMALGSRPVEIARLLLREGAGWMATGLAVGAAGIAVIVRLLGDLVYGVRPYDPIALGVAIAVLFTCATLALLVPVRRATKVDPVVALRAQ
jgi:predicted permease